MTTRLTVGRNNEPIGDFWYMYGNLNTRVGKCDSTFVCVVRLVASVQPPCMVKHLSDAARMSAVMYMCVTGHAYVC